MSTVSAHYFSSIDYCEVLLNSGHPTITGGGNMMSNVSYMMWYPLVRFVCCAIVFSGTNNKNMVGLFMVKFNQPSPMLFYICTIQLSAHSKRIQKHQLTNIACQCGWHWVLTVSSAYHHEIIDPYRGLCHIWRITICLFVSTVNAKGWLSTMGLVP